MLEIKDYVRVIGSDVTDYQDGEVIGYDDADRDAGIDYDVTVLWDKSNSCDVWPASLLAKLEE